VPGLFTYSLTLESWWASDRVMVRFARVVAPGYLHQVTQRGNRRMQTFFGDGDYRAYLVLLAGNELCVPPYRSRGGKLAGEATGLPNDHCFDRAGAGYSCRARGGPGLAGFIDTGFASFVHHGTGPTQRKQSCSITCHGEGQSP